MSIETELLVSDPSRKNRSALVSILYISISSIQNNYSTYLSLPSLSEKSLFPSSTLGYK